MTGDETTRDGNWGEGTACGLAWFIRKTMTGKFLGWLAISYSQYGRQDYRTGQAFDFEYDQPLMISAVCKYRFNKRYALSGKFWYHSGAPYSPITGGVEDPEHPASYAPVYGEINSERLPDYDYSRLDLRFDYTPVRFSGLSLYAELINATNHTNVTGYDYSPDHTERDEISKSPRFVSFWGKERVGLRI